MGTLAFVGALVGAGVAPHESLWPGAPTNIATKMWNGNISNGALGGSGYTQNTFCVTLDLEEQCDQIRFIFGNTGAAATNIAEMRIYFGAATPTGGVTPVSDANFRADQTNDAVAVTFTTAGTTSLAAYTESVASIRKPKYLVSDWVSLSSKDRTDAVALGHNRPMLYIRYCLDVVPADNIGLTTTGANTLDFYINGVTSSRGYPDISGRWLVSNNAAGNLCSSSATSCILFPYGTNGTGPLCGVQYRTKTGNILSFAAIGDSITEGATKGSDATHGSRRWPMRLAYALSDAGLKTERMQFGYSGKTSATYRALWEYFVEQTGIVPPMAIYAAYSPNDGPGNPISGANATDLNSFIAHSTTNNIVTAIWTGLPSSKWTPSYVETESKWSQSADANRVAYNASIVAGTFGADFVIDQAPQFEILGTGSGGVGTAYGMIASLTNGGYANPAGWHPDYVGYTAMIDSFSSVLTAPINDYFA